VANVFFQLGDKLAGWFGGAATEKHMANFAGRWFTTFGPMELSQNGDRVQGSYQFQGNRCSIEGSMRDGRFQFCYREPTAEGEGWFVIERHGKFSGQWRAKDAETWSAWVGQREFEGVWDSSFGLLRLVQEHERVLGFYEGQGPSALEGRMENNRLPFRYRELRAQGEGHFELGADAASFDGEWRADGSEQWAPWRGRRLMALPGVLWLVVIEAHWQRSYLEKEYAFGHMLREFFTRLPHVNIRHRFFEDEIGLERWCRELMYLPEPVVVVFASHGTQDGLSVHDRPLDTGRLVESLRYADNIQLLHFSSCLMMQDGKGGELARALQEAVRFPISGYDRSVDWAASALIEFQYLDMILGRGFSPADAADRVLRLISYAGDKDVPGSPYPAAGFRILMPNSHQDLSRK
jgi:hypothetical protein